MLVFAWILCNGSRERNQHSPTCQWLAFSHNSISTLVKQRGLSSHGPLFDPATVPNKHTNFNQIAQISQIQVRASWFRRGGHQEGLEECAKNEKWSRQQETTGVTTTRGRQKNPFNTSPYKHRVKKWHLIVFLPSTCAPSLFHILTLHFLLPPSPTLTLWLSVSGYTFFYCFLCDLEHFSSLADCKSCSVMDWDADS